MKFSKKLALLVTATSIFLSCGIAAACSDDTNSSSGTSSSIEQSSSEAENYTYKIRVQSASGFGFRDVNVVLKSGEESVASLATNSRGNAVFEATHVAVMGEYTVALENLPVGWKLEREDAVYVTSATAKDMVITLAPTGTDAMQGVALPDANFYSLGEMMYDFSLTTSTGETFSLYETLQTHDAVMLNFWYDGCSWCQKEFPYMVQAYNSVYETVGGVDVLYKDKVAILCISNQDSNGDIEAYKNRYKDSFDLSTIDLASEKNESNQLTRMFGITAFPTSVMIDRYGIVTELHQTALLSRKQFTDVFDKFIGDDYVQNIQSGGGEEGGENGTLEYAPSQKENPEIMDVEAILNANVSNPYFAASWEGTDTAWPFLIATGDDQTKYLYSSNSEIDYSYSALELSFTAAANTAISFDYWVNSEYGPLSASTGDALYVTLDGVLLHKLCGTTPNWTTCYTYVFEDGEQGKHTLSLVYHKDGDSLEGEDVIKLKNFKVFEKSELQTDDVDANIFRYAATGYNDPKTTEGAAATTAYKNYITPVLNTQDGYYHVGEANGPLLFADLMNPTRWNSYDIWQLAYNQMLIYNGFDLKDSIEPFAWTEAQIDMGVVPVTEDLKDILQNYVTTLKVFGENSDKPYHANEWLEICHYYSHYGNTPQMQDPTRGVSYDGAIEVVLGENHIVCDKSLVPLGIKHKFKAPQTGVYRIRSLVPKELEDTDSCYNPQCWIVAPDRETFLAQEEDNLLFSGKGNAENFEVYVPFTAGETYYMLFAFFLNDVGEFDLSIEYMGAEATYVEHCAIGPFTYNPVTNETVVLFAKEVELADDGYYYVVENGERVSKLYLDLTHPNYLFSNGTLQGVIESASSYLEYKRAFYLDGVDYTPIMEDYLFYADFNNGDLNGMAAVDEQLMEIMLKFSKKHDGFGGVENSWQFMCYYEKTLRA